MMYRKVAIIFLSVFVLDAAAGGADLRNLPRDRAKEAWVKDLLAQFGLTNDIRVVRDRSLESRDNEVCAYATVRHGLQWIAYGADCVKGNLKPVNERAGISPSQYNLLSTGVMCHETAHILSLHGPAPSGKGEWARQLEAERFAGFCLAVLGATIEEARAYGSAGQEQGKSWMPPRDARLKVVEEGWHLAQASNRRALQPPGVPQVPPQPMENANGYSWSLGAAVLGIPVLLFLGWTFWRAASAPQHSENSRSRGRGSATRLSSGRVARYPRARSRRERYA